jgi:hypothetical protein
MMFRISASVPLASGQWVMSACQTSLGRSASNRRQDERGRLVGLWGDEPAAGQDPPDGGDRRAAAGAALQVPGDGFGAGVVSCFGEFFAEGDDETLDAVGDVPRVAVRPARAGFERGFTFRLVAGDQGLDPAPGHAVVTGDFTFAAAFDDDCCDHDPGHRHRPPPRSSGCKRCRETPVNYVVNSDTPTSTM